MTLDGKDLKKNPEEEMIEEQTAEGQEIEENKLEEQLQKMTEDVEIPESLKPENIEKMLKEKANQKIPLENSLYGWRRCRVLCSCNRNCSFWRIISKE